MSTAKHTPGPWKTLHSDLSQTAQYIVIDEGAVKKSMRSVRLIGIASDGNPHCEANARLMAAAPELLAALRNLLAVSVSGADEIEAAKAAIAKTSYTSSTTATDTPNPHHDHE